MAAVATTKDASPIPSPEGRRSPSPVLDFGADFVDTLAGKTHRYAAVGIISPGHLKVPGAEGDSLEIESDVPLSNKTTPDSSAAPDFGSPSGVVDGSSSPDSGDEAIVVQKKAVRFEIPALARSPARSPVAETESQIRRELLEVPPPHLTPSGRAYTTPVLLSPAELHREIEERRRHLDATNERLSRMLVDHNTSVHHLSERMESVAEKEAARAETLRRLNRATQKVHTNMKLAQFLLIFFLIAIVTMLVLKYKFPHRF